jgi:phage gpG-like protein
MLNIEVQGIEGVLTELAQLQNRSARVTTALARDTGLVIQAEVDEVFDTAPDTVTGGNVYGGKNWKALSNAYLKRRPERVGGQIYRDSGELLQSLTVGGAGNLLQSNSDTVTFGTALPKAGRLQKDRNFLFATPAMVEAVARLWEDYIAKGKV